MALAMFDVPLCLDVESFFVGTEAPAPVPSRGWRAAWPGWKSDAGTASFRVAAVEQCLDTAGVLRSYREPLPGETWLLPADSERRLLAQANAIIGLGEPALHQVQRLAIDADLPDPARMFASLFVMGCVAGGRWLGSMRDVLLQALARDPAEAAAAIEAMCLAPQPGVARVLRPLLRSDAGAERAGAVRILAYRGELDPAAWSCALRDQDPRVLLAALSTPLYGRDTEDCEGPMQAVCQDHRESIVRAALLAGASLRLRCTHARALWIATRDPSWADAADALALHGDVTDAVRLRGMLHGMRRDHAVVAAATLGSAELIPDLLVLLREGGLRPEENALIQSAITRITGVATGSTAAMQRAWNDCADLFLPQHRYRHGRILDSSQLICLLEAPAPASRGGRQRLYVELCGHAGGHVPRFHACDFVGVQRAALRRIKAWLAQQTISSHLRPVLAQ